MASWLAGPYSAMASASAMEPVQEGDSTNRDFNVSLWNEHFGALLNTSSSLLQRSHHDARTGTENNKLHESVSAQTSVSGPLARVSALPKEPLLSPRYLSRDTFVTEVHTKRNSVHNFDASESNPSAAEPKSVRIFQPHQPEATNLQLYPTELLNSVRKNVVICCCRKRRHAERPRLLYIREIRKLRRYLEQLASLVTRKQSNILPSSTSRLLKNLNKLFGKNISSPTLPSSSPPPSPVPTSISRVHQNLPPSSSNNDIPIEPQINPLVQQTPSSVNQILQPVPISHVDNLVSTIVQDEHEEDEYLSLLKSRMNESLGDLTSSIENIVKSKGVTIAPFSRLSLFNDLSSSSIQQPSSFSFTSHTSNHEQSKASLFDDELHQLLRRVSMSSLSPAPSITHVQQQSPPPKSPLNRSDLSLSPNESVISWLSSPEMLSPSPSPSLSRTKFTPSISRPSVPVFASNDVKQTSPSRKGPVKFSSPEHEPSNIFRESKSALHVLSEKVRRTEGFFKRALDAIDPSIWPSTSPTT